VTIKYRPLKTEYVRPLYLCFTVPHESV
jgi:hypothetical protein